MANRRESCSPRKTESRFSAPLGRPTDDTGARAKIALAEVEGSLGYIVGKKVGLPDGRSIVFHLSGPLARDIAVVVDGRARVVERVTQADVEIGERVARNLRFTM